MRAVFELDGTPEEIEAMRAKIDAAPTEIGGTLVPVRLVTHLNSKSTDPSIVDSWRDSTRTMNEYVQRRIQKDAGRR